MCSVRNRIPGRDVEVTVTRYGNMQEYLCENPADEWETGDDLFSCTDGSVYQYEEKIAGPEPMIAVYWDRARYLLILGKSGKTYDLWCDSRGDWYYIEEPGYSFELFRRK